MMEAIIIDTETNSLYGEVIELAWSEIGYKDCVHCERFNPSEPMDARAAAVHHISPRELKECRPSHQASQSLPPSKIWIGHNIIYDWERLGRPVGIKLICTYQLAKLMWPKISSYNLDSLFLSLYGVNHVTIRQISFAHSAETDVIICRRVLERIVSESNIAHVSQLPSISHPEMWKENDVLVTPRESIDVE